MLRHAIISSKTLTLTHPIIHRPTLALNDTNLNSYSVSSNFLDIGFELTMDHPLDNPFDLPQRAGISW